MMKTPIFILVSVLFFHFGDSTSKKEIKTKLLDLYNGAGPLLDFVFFTNEEAEEHTKKVDILKRTELQSAHPTKQDTEPGGTEKSLVMALKYLKLGENVNEIKKASQPLVRLLYGGPMSEQAQKNEFQEIRLPMQGINVEVEDSKRDDVIYPFTEHIQSKPTYFANVKIDKHSFNANKEILGHDKGKMVDLRSQIAIDKRTCYPKGGSTDSHLIRLCGVCVKTVDFGQTVIPRFVKSIECDSSTPTCLSGSGMCKQKVVFYSFLRKTLTNDQQMSWQPFQQPINASCECQCSSGSLLHPLV